MSAQNLATVRRAIEEAINKGNLSVIDELVASQYVYHEPGVGDLQGPDGLKQLITGYRNAFPDLRLTIEDQIDGGNTVVTRWTATGTHQGELLGIPATGRRVSVTGIIIARMEGGKIAEEWENYDALGMLQQLGVVQTSGQAAGQAASARASTPNR